MVCSLEGNHWSGIRLAMYRRPSVLFTYGITGQRKGEYSICVPDGAWPGLLFTFFVYSTYMRKTFESH